jgi:hypothetical protein
MSNSLVSKFIDILRSRIRFARYHQSLNPFQHNPHPVTLGPEQLSRFFTYVANNERVRT